MKTAEEFVNRLSRHPMSDKALIEVLESYAKEHAKQFGSHIFRDHFGEQWKPEELESTYIMWIKDK